LVIRKFVQSPLFAFAPFFINSEVGYNMHLFLGFWR
jgi:hypothetical protein